MLFLINLVLAVATLWNAFEDHSEALSEFRDSNGPEKVKSWRKLFLLWLFPVLSIAAIPLTWNAETESEDQISKAKAEAALANDRSSTNELRVAEIKATNLVLIGIGEKAKGFAALATEAAEKAKTERALAEKAVEEFRQTNLDLQNRVEQLKATNRQLSQLVFKLTPRQLTYDQTSWLRTFLQGRDKTVDEPVLVRVDDKDSESYRFALDIVSALATSGVRVTNILPYTASVLTPLEISFPINKPLPPMAAWLANGFSWIGYKPVVSRGLTSDGVAIYVGGNREYHDPKREHLVIDGTGKILFFDFVSSATKENAKDENALKMIKSIQVKQDGTNAHVEMVMESDRNFRLPPLLFSLDGVKNVFGEPGKGPVPSWNFSFPAPSKTNLNEWQLRLDIWP